MANKSVRRDCPIRSGWQTLSESEARAAAKRLCGGDLPSEKAGLINVSRVRLPFYEACELYYLYVSPGRRFPGQCYYAIVLDDEVFPVSGSPFGIHQINARQQLQLQRRHLKAYLGMYLLCTHDVEGPYLRVESMDNVPELYLPTDQETAMARQLKAAVQPTEWGPASDDESYCVKATMFYGNGLYHTDIQISAAGEVAIRLGALLIGDIPERLLPRWNRFSDLAELKPAPPPDLAEPLQLERRVHRDYVEWLLEQALADPQHATLLQQLSARPTATSVIEQFADYVLSHWPVIAIQSDLPFVEELIAQSIERARPALSPSISKAAEDGENALLRIALPHRDGSLLVFSVHTCRGVHDEERVAHALVSGAVGALIGCHRIEDLPMAIQRVVDITLDLPAPDERRFDLLFKRLTGNSLPAGWPGAEGAGWVRHLEHFDFQQPVRLHMPPLQALAFLKARVTGRLAGLDPQTGPGLQDLHGIGEAKVLAEDLIEDLRAALAGEIRWADVDRGLLLVGAPGTGKTTLARAIARDCGVRFLTASAAGWQAAGHLGDHIRAMRASFREARRCTPSILFIDEIDSLGNRSNFVGHNASYSTQVVNALLEQMQGLNEQAPVIVIAATNDLEQVDPALTRAGRLDKVVVIPFPDAEGLGAIYDYHLRAHRRAGQCAPDLSVSDLAQLSVGLTGADVESYVRGAARRARKRGGAIGQADLIAEIVGTPRTATGSPRLSLAERYRVAVHEAGHALSRCMSSTQGKDITYMSIIPRSDGSLGFVASCPTGKCMQTRDDYLEQIRVALAGRAAEELIFGRRQVSGGAGGTSPSSDLAIATRIARSLICEYGLGATDDLRWSRQADPEQSREISALLSAQFEIVKTSLGHQADALKLLASRLVACQELSGDGVRALIRHSLPEATADSHDAGSVAPPWALEASGSRS